MPANGRAKKGGSPTFHAVQSRAIFYQYMFIAVAITVIALVVLAVTVNLMLTTEPAVYHVFIMAFTFALMVLGVDMGRHNLPKGSRESVIVDLRSVRLLDEGRVQKEFVFDARVRIGIIANQAFYVPDMKPLHGIEFERDGDVIEVSPRESYQLDDVRRLWPFAMIIAKAHDLRPTPTFIKVLKTEAKKGGYWEEIHDELLGEKRPRMPKPKRPSKPKTEGE